MAFPVVETTAESAVTTAGTSHTVNLPSGIVSGNLLLIFFSIGSTAATLNSVTDWFELVDVSAARDTKILYRQADGSEGSTLGLTTSASTKSATIAYRISGAENPATQAPQLSTLATGTSTAPDPGTCTPTGGAKDYLWIAQFSLAGEEADDDTWCNSAPADYTGLLQVTAGVAGTNIGVENATAHRQVNAASQNPGTFSVDVSLAWRAYTVAVHPSSTVTLTVADSAQSQPADNVALTQVHVLAVADTAQSQAVDAVALTQQHVLAVAETSQAQTTDNVTLDVSSTLAVADIAQSHGVDTVTLTQVHSLTVADTGQGQTTDAVALVQQHNLAAADVTQTHTADGVVLTQVHALTVADTAQSQQANNVALTQVHDVILTDSGQIQTANSIALTQLHILALAAAVQAQSGDAIDLVQQHSLTVIAAAQAQPADSLTLVTGDDSTTLVVANAIQVHVAGGITFSQKHSPMFCAAELAWYRALCLVCQPDIAFRNPDKSVFDAMANSRSSGYPLNR